MRYKKKAIVVTSDPLALVAEKTKVSKTQRERVVQSTPKEVMNDESIQGLFINLQKKPLLRYLTTHLIQKGSEYETSKYYDNSTNYGLFVDNDDDQEIFHDAIEFASENFIEYHIVSQTDHDQSEVNRNDFEEKDHLVDKLIKKFNQKIAKCQKQVLQEQLKVKHVVIDTHTECQAQYAKLEEERYQYMIRYSALCDNDKQHRKKIDEQEILFDKMSPKASSLQSWLWHQRLSHLNFATINNLVKNNLVRGLPKMKFEKDHLCSACEQGKIHRKHHKSKTAFASNKPLYLLHMDLCGPMRMESINGKRYVFFVVDDYSRYTWMSLSFSNDYDDVGKSQGKGDIGVIEPANMAEALKDADWTIIKTKWIFKNKKDESSLVIQNKARLVTVGYCSQEGIDYDETFAPVASKLRLYAYFFAYAAHKRDISRLPNG
ncbi:retrovirus-related pol polyprotein from transposon TNT 1-94 [Tanacetum coccineum]